MASSEDVLEGFLCPICMTDLKTPQQLTKHFEEFHNDDPEILKSLKGLSFIFKFGQLSLFDLSHNFLIYFYFYI